MKKHKSFWEVWEQVGFKDGEDVCQYVDTYEELNLAIELCRWNNNYYIKKLGRDNND